MSRFARRPIVVLGLLLACAGAKAQRMRPATTIEIVRGDKLPFSAAIFPSANFVQIGTCQAVYIELHDESTKDVPRNPIGYRIGTADFDWSAIGKRADAAVGAYDGPNAWKVCACQAAVLGTTINITASYPARSLSAKAQIPGLAFRASIELPVAKAPGTLNPNGCDEVASTDITATTARPAAAAAMAPPASAPIATAPSAITDSRARRTGVSLPAPAPVISPAPVTPPAAAPVVTSGRYRVVANGFRVLHETKDDILSRDGKGDEVYGAFTMFHYDRHTGTLLDRDLRRTLVVGDVWNFPGRVKGGSWSATGGFRAGDKYPASGEPFVRHGAPSRDTFPFLIWEGPLSDGLDAVVILPTIWEYDGGTAVYDQWFFRELADQQSIWAAVGVQEMIGGHKLGVVVPSGELGAPGGVSATAPAGFQTTLLQIGAMFGITSFDRPLGMKNVGGFAVLPRRAVVLTREIIEASLQQLASMPTSDADALSRAATALNDLQNSVTSMGTSSGSTTSSSAQPNAGLPYGTIAIPLIDGQGQDFQGQYVMYIQVERIP